MKFNLYRSSGKNNLNEQSRATKAGQRLQRRETENPTINTHVILNKCVFKHKSHPAGEKQRVLRRVIMPRGAPDPDTRPPTPGIRL